MTFKFSRKRFISLSCVVMMAGLGLACSSQPPQGAPGGGQRPPTPVVGFTAQMTSVAETLALVGTLAANESVQVSSNVDGFIESIPFEEGQRVKAGDTLVVLDQKKLKAELDRAQADLDLAQTTLKRYQTLGSGGAIATQEVERVVAEEAGARARVDVAQENLEDATITAPFDGTIGERLVSPGQYVQRGMALTSLISQNPMKAEFRVPERFLRQIEIGQTINLTLAAYPKEVFSGEVYFIDPQLETTSRTVLVKARVANEDGRLRRGMFANLNLIVTVKEKAVLIPESALMWKQENAMAYVVSAENTAEIRPVKLGIRQAGFVEIVSGIQPNETVIIEGIQKIGPGAPVAVRLEERALTGA